MGFKDDFMAWCTTFLLTFDYNVRADVLSLRRICEDMTDTSSQAAVLKCAIRHINIR